jgi:hypothetical protein
MQCGRWEAAAFGAVVGGAACRHGAGTRHLDHCFRKATTFERLIEPLLRDRLAHDTRQEVLRLKTLLEERS